MLGINVHIFISQRLGCRTWDMESKAGRSHHRRGTRTVSGVTPAAAAPDDRPGHRHPRGTVRHLRPVRQPRRSPTRRSRLSRGTPQTRHTRRPPARRRSLKPAEAAEAKTQVRESGSLDPPNGRTLDIANYLMRAAGLIEQRDAGPRRLNRIRTAECNTAFPGLLDAILGVQCPERPSPVQ